MITYNPNTIKNEVVDPFFQEWDQLSRSIFEAHDKRLKTVKDLMEKGIDLYEKLILTCSYSKTSIIDSSEQYEVLPVNGMERLLFVKTRPGQYASFRQLDELFKETKKKIARLRILAENQ